MIGSPTLFLDLDGVLADLDAYFPALFGVDHRKMASAEMWKKISGAGTFFLDMPPCPGAIEFFHSVAHLRPIILTASSRSTFEHVARQKREWVRKHLGPAVPIMFSYGSALKHCYLQNPGDILIDDFDRNCARWRAAGGVAIHHQGDLEDTGYRLGAEIGR